MKPRNAGIPCIILQRALFFHGPISSLCMLWQYVLSIFVWSRICWDWFRYLNLKDCYQMITSNSLLLLQAPNFCYPYSHGLRTPNEAFFHQNPKLLGLGRQFGQINFGAFAVFSNNLSAPILVLWVRFPCFSLINQYFYKKM